MARALLIVGLLGFAGFIACSEQAAQKPSGGLPPVAPVSAPQQPGAPAALPIPEEKTLSVAVFPRDPASGTSLRAEVGRRGKTGALSYQWLRNGDVIGGQTGDTLGPGYFSKGDQIAVRVTETLEGGVSHEAVSGAQWILNSPPRILTVRIWPNPLTRNEDLLARVNAVDPDGDPITFIFRWVINGTPVPGVSDERLPKTLYKKGDLITVEVKAHDGEATGVPVRSEPFPVRNAPPIITSTAPGSQEVTTTYTYQVTAVDGDEDPLTFSLKSAPAGMTIDPEKGLITWPLPDHPKGQHRVVVAVTDPEGSQALQEYLLTIK